MEENWFLKLTKASWTPIVLGALVCIGVTIVAQEVEPESVIAGLGIVAFGWIAMIKGFMKEKE